MVKITFFRGLRTGDPERTVFRSVRFPGKRLKVTQLSASFHDGTDKFGERWTPFAWRRDDENGHPVWYRTDVDPPTPWEGFFVDIEED